MAEMDLNIDNYSVTDLENFFKLKSKTYQAADVEKREYEIREQLLSSGHVNKVFKRDLIIFLKEAKNRMLQTLPQIAPPTTIQKNAVLDKVQVPQSAELPTSRTPYIIERPPTQYVNVQSSEFYQGIINPLSTRTLTKYITVDTRFRDRFYETMSSDFMINLPTRINKVVSMQLTSLELPKDFYSISCKYGNNYFVMQVFQMVDGIGYESDRIVVIPDGNYTAQGLVKQINDILCPTFPNGLLKNVDDIFSYIQFILLTSDDGSGSNKIYVKLNPDYPTIIAQIEEVVLNFGTDIEGNNDSKYITTKLGWNLGFTNTIYHGKTQYVGEKPIEPNAIKYIYLAVDDFNKSVNNSFMTAFEKNGLKPNILARISMSGKGYDNVILNKPYKIITEPRAYFGPVDIQRLQIRLFDDHGRILHMNHSDYAFCLKIVVMYDL
jgi:hypothetical protein